MFEQYGGLYYQEPSEIQNPNNSTYKRLYQSLVDGKFYLRLYNGTDELFATGISPAFTVYSLFQDLNTVGNVGGGEDILYSNAIVANKLSSNGDTIHAEYALTCANTANAKVIRAYFGGQKIFESTNDYSVGTKFELSMKLIFTRTTSGSAKTIVTYTANGITETQYLDFAAFAPIFDYTIANNLAITGEAVADNDITANLSKGVFVPSVN